MENADGCAGFFLLLTIIVIGFFVFYYFNAIFGVIFIGMIILIKVITKIIKFILEKNNEKKRFN